MSKKFLYLFKEGHDAFGGDQTTMKNTLGGKGAGLAEMTHAGMPVPQGFTITTEACTQYYADNREINDEIKADIFKYMGILEEQTGKTFGSIENPLLVSVRSGARQSMPGMMDTILNLGLNDQAVEGLAKKTDNPRFAYDCYRRFIQMYSDVVMELGKSFFEERIDAMKVRKGVTQDVELDAEDLKELVKEFKQIYLEKQGEEFPQDPKEQLIGAVKAVFRSWDNPRANVYRKMNEIPYEWGTAVNVQQMAFGNSGSSDTGDNGHYALTTKTHNIKAGPIDVEVYANYGFDSKAVDSDARLEAWQGGLVLSHTNDSGVNKVILRYSDNSDNSVYNKTDDLTTVYASFEGSHKFTQQAQVEYLLAFHDYDNGKDNTDNRKNYGAIVRPMYFWNDVHSTWLEAGYQRVDYDQGGDNHGWKLTLSQNIAIGMGPEFRPMLRFYVTGGQVDNEHTAKVNGTQDQQLDSLNVGGMFEAWF